MKKIFQNDIYVACNVSNNRNILNSSLNYKDNLTDFFLNLSLKGL